MSCCGQQVYARQDAEGNPFLANGQAEPAGPTDLSNPSLYWPPPAADEPAEALVEAPAE